MGRSRSSGGCAGKAGVGAWWEELLSSDGLRSGRKTALRGVGVAQPPVLFCTQGLWGKEQLCTVAQGPLDSYAKD